MASIGPCRSSWSDTHAPGAGVPTTEMTGTARCPPGAGSRRRDWCPCWPRIGPGASWPARRSGASRPSRPLSDALGVPIESMGELEEGHGPDALRLLHRMAGETAVLCTHGDVATVVLDALAAGRSAEARHRLRLLKGEVWVIRAVGFRPRDRRPPPPAAPPMTSGPDSGGGTRRAGTCRPLR